MNTSEKWSQFSSEKKRTEWNEWDGHLSKKNIGKKKKSYIQFNFLKTEFVVFMVCPRRFVWGAVFALSFH